MALAASLATATALSGVGLVLGSAPARAAETLGNATQLTTVPADIVSVVEGTTRRSPSATVGGRGSVAANAAALTGCAPSGAYADPQWYTLPGWSGKVVIRAINHSRVTVESPRASFAVLDADTLAVVDCSPSVIPLDPAYPRLLVAYYPRHHECSADDLLVFGCSETRSDYRLAWTSGSSTPVNDRWEDATPVGSLPYVATVDTTFATSVGRDLTPSDHCFGYAADVSASLWWRFTPTTSGPLWIQSGATWGEQSYVHVVKALPSGGFDPYDESLAGCGGLSATLTAGTTYYIAVYNANNDSDWYTFSGSKAILRIASDQAGMPPDRSAGVSAAPAAHTGTLGWWGPASPGGYRVARDGTDLVGAGPWSAVVPDAYPSSLSFTFPNLRQWQAYEVSSTPVLGPGVPGYPVTRAVFLHAPTPSAPRNVAAVPGSRTARVTWRAPAYIGVAVVSGYRVRRYVGSSVLETVTLSATARSHTFTGLPAGKQFRFDVTAINSSGDGLASPQTGVITIAP